MTSSAQLAPLLGVVHLLYLLKESGDLCFVDPQCEGDLKHAEYYFMLEKSNHGCFIEGRKRSNDKQANLNSSLVVHVAQ